MPAAEDMAENPGACHVLPPSGSSLFFLSSQAQGCAPGLTHLHQGASKGVAAPSGLVPQGWATTGRPFHPRRAKPSAQSPEPVSPARAA